MCVGGEGGFVTAVGEAKRHKKESRVGCVYMAQKGPCVYMDCESVFKLFTNELFTWPLRDCIYMDYKCVSKCTLNYSVYMVYEGLCK